MNLYLFNDNDSAAVYGIGTYLKELTHALEGAAVHIHIVHLHSIYPKFEIVKTNQVENWYIPKVHRNLTSTDTIQEIENYYQNVIYLLRLYIKDSKDLIFHFNYNHSQLLTKELKETFNCKTVATVHYVKWQLELHGNLHRWHSLKTKPEKQRSSFEQLLCTTDEYESLLYQETDLMIVLSEHTLHMLETEYQLDSNKTSIIPNGLSDTNLINNRKDLLKKWHITEDEFLILFVGRLDTVKGLIFLISAFRKLLEVIPNCRLIIAGNGNYDPYIQVAGNICTKITFTGLLEKAKLYELYQIANMGVMPSLHEQCSYVAIEMMMHSVPLIASTSTGLKEMVIDGETGLHIPVIEYLDRVEIDSSLLAEKMLYLLQHPKERKRMGINARRLYLKRYSLPVFRKNMLAFYQSLLQS